jgi:hypothetical protein
MTTRIVIEFEGEQGVRSVLLAIEAYQQRLRAGIGRSKRRLAEFEARYGVDTARFLDEWAAEDLAGSDLEYVEWAGEARLLENLEQELTELEQVRHEFPGVP